MTTRTTERAPIPFNPKMLRWAREWRDRSPEDAARKIGKKPSDILRWELGDGRPTVRQARGLAEFYDRPFVEFFLDRPPEMAVAANVPDFRLYREAGDGGGREIALIQAWAEEQRLNALDLFGLVGGSPPIFPGNLHFSTSDHADVAAQKARASLAFPIEEQTSLRGNERDTLPRIFRKKLEAVGVLTLKHSDLAEYGARGMCLALFPLPVIVFASEAPTAQAFTLGHELGHVLLRQSAVSGAVPQKGGASSVRAVEEWCDRFAAAFLVPEEALKLDLPSFDMNAESISDDFLNVIANRFRISSHAMLLRMVHLRYVKPSYYWDIKRPEFLQSEKEYQSFGRAQYYGSRYRNQKGDLYTSLVLDAWSNGAITNHSAAEFMGIRNLKHLDDVRSWFRP